MRIALIIPRWPKDSFWNVFAFKFPLLSTSLLAGLTSSYHDIHIINESLTEIGFEQKVDFIGEAYNGLEISLFACSYFGYHFVNAGTMNPQIIRNFIQSKSIIHASHLEEHISLVLSPSTR
jgi:hypothetical protein